MGSSPQPMPGVAPPPRIPVWVKLLYTGFVAVLVPLYWWHYGPANFLWFCDIAVVVTVPALWLESRFLASMQLTGIFLPSLLWLVDYFYRLLTGSFLVFFTTYMFDEKNPLLIRALSLYHGWLPFLLLWLVWRLGYDSRGWVAQSLLAWAILPVCYVFTDPVRRLNGAFGPFEQPQQWVPGGVWLAAIMLAYPLGVFLPTHLLMRAVFRRRPPAA